MTKKKKIVLISIAIATIVAVLAVSLSLYFVYRSKGPFGGTVFDTETNAPIANVMVTDGRNVVKTDSDGKFTLDGYYNSRFVTVTVPSGYNAEEFFIPVSQELESYDFKLTKTNPDYENGHSFLQISDTEIGADSAVEWIDHVKGLVEELQPSFLIHTGDICYESGLKRHINEMNSENMGLPVRYIIGNHDYVKWGGYGEALFESIYGPVWYSFDVANVHYIVTPFQVGGDVASGYNNNDRWKWLENDLANVDPDKKVVMFNHNAPPSEDYVISYGTKKLDLKQHNLAAWIFGHYHNNFVEMNDGVLKVSTSRPDSGGIDSSLSGTRHITVNSDGTMQTKMHYYDYDGAAETPQDAVWSNEELEGNVLFADTMLVGDTVFVGTSDDDFPRECGVYSVDATTGTTRWYYSTRNSVKNKLVYQNGKIIAQDASGWVYCIDAATGEFVWEKKVGLGNTFTTSTGIVADGETVYVGCASEITALRISDGEVVWTDPRKSGESSPADFVIVGDKLIVSSHWDALVAYNKNTGKQLWENDESPLRFRSSTPAVLDANTLLVADDSAIMLVNLADGKMTVLQTYEDVYTFNSSSQPLIQDGVAYIATANKGVIAFDIATKTVKWNVETGKSLIFTAPYAGGNSAAVESSFVTKDGFLIFGASDGYLYKVSMNDGSIAAKINVGAPIFGQVAIHNNQIIVSDFEGRMFKLAI